jgi:hypothetical protein
VTFHPVISILESAHVPEEDFETNEGEEEDFSTGWGLQPIHLFTYVEGLPNL